MTREEVPKFLDDVSDDVYGLWEFDWVLNSHEISPSREERIRLLVDLITADLVEIRFGRLGSTLDPLPIDKAVQKVSDPVSWMSRETVEQPVVSVTTTAIARGLLNPKLR